MTVQEEIAAIDREIARLMEERELLLSSEAASDAV